MMLQRLRKFARVYRDLRGEVPSRWEHLREAWEWSGRSVTPLSGPMGDIMATTLRNCTPRFAEQLQRNNALLERLKEHR